MNFLQDNNTIFGKDDCTVVAADIKPQRMIFSERSSSMNNNDNRRIVPSNYPKASSRNYT